ncbi:hypothetical protein CU098_012766 [Rhizopus stolonifer]|uniref:Uncharacterized protein n=1 Tax=Rhizopus stolonifer TaxID=4846 RepID=A0A367KN29_RHIST|nr:hypothetical protein CU098_012766 [Rhizopus stolonifer]
MEDLCGTQKSPGSSSRLLWGFSTPCAFQLRINTFVDAVSVQPSLTEALAVEAMYIDLRTCQETTGSDGAAPQDQYEFYDEIGKIVANDRAISPRARIGAQINNEGLTLDIYEPPAPPF